MVPQIAFWPVCDLARGADYILSTFRTETSIGLPRENNRPPMLRDVLKINTSAVLAVSAAQLLELAWKCLK